MPAPKIAESPLFQPPLPGGAIDLIALLRDHIDRPLVPRDRSDRSGSAPQPPSEPASGSSSVTWIRSISKASPASALYWVRCTLRGRPPVMAWPLVLSSTKPDPIGVYSEAPSCVPFSSRMIRMVAAEFSGLIADRTNAEARYVAPATEEAIVAGLSRTE